MSQDPRFTRSPDAIAREVDGEVLIVPVVDQILDLDDCFHLLKDPVSVRVWELLETSRTLDELVGEVTREFEVEADVARGDLERFLGDLVRVGAASRFG